MRVRQLTLKRLKMIGYHILEAENGPKAVEILKDEHSVDLVLTDLIMPGGMSGREVATRAQLAHLPIGSNYRLRLGTYAFAESC